MSHFLIHLTLSSSDTIIFQKRQMEVIVSTLEYLYGFATTNQGHFMLLGIYRPPRIKYRSWALGSILRRIICYVGAAVSAELPYRRLRGLQHTRGPE